MYISIFLAKVLGLYLVITTLSLLVNRATTKSILTDVVKSPGLLYLSGTIALILGILLISVHNIWVADWRVLITLIAWLSFIKGLFITVFSPSVTKHSKKLLAHPYFLPVSYVVSFLIGAYLCYWGFELNPLTGLVE